LEQCSGTQCGLAKTVQFAHPVTGKLDDVPTSHGTPAIRFVRSPRHHRCQNTQWLHVGTSAMCWCHHGLEPRLASPRINPSSWSAFSIRRCHPADRSPIEHSRSMVARSREIRDLLDPRREAKRRSRQIRAKNPVGSYFQDLPNETPIFAGFRASAATDQKIENCTHREPPHGFHGRPHVMKNPRPPLITSAAPPSQLLHRPHKPPTVRNDWWKPTAQPEGS